MASTVSSSSEKDTTDDTFRQRLRLYYEQAFRLGEEELPVQNFGGLSFWNTTQQTKFRVIFILGGPGAGKGTQSALMAENYPNVVHLSVGQLLRQEQTKADSPHRALIEQALVAGSIVPVEISLALVKQAMQEQQQRATTMGNNNSGKDVLFLIDGFPRNQDNLSGWCKYMGDVASVWSVLFYTCPLNVLEQRLLERAQSSGRSDDNLKSIHKRFATFEQETVPIVRQMQTLSQMTDADLSPQEKDDDDTNEQTRNGAQKWSVMEIAGDQTLDQVWLATQQALNQLIRHDVLTANAQLLHAVEQGNALAYKEWCDPLWFANSTATTTSSETPSADQELDVAMEVLQNHEGTGADDPSTTTNILSRVCNAELEFISGQHVAVSYTRPLGGQMVREKRLWVYSKGDEKDETSTTRGWRNVHFTRTPVSQPS